MSILKKIFGTEEKACGCGIDLDKEINEAKKDEKTKKKSSCCSVNLDEEIKKAKSK